jgi:hypothetical protein
LKARWRGKLEMKVFRGPEIGNKVDKQLATMRLKEAIKSFSDQTVKNRGVVLNIIMDKQGKKGNRPCA